METTRGRISRRSVKTFEWLGQWVITDLYLDYCKGNHVRKVQSSRMSFLQGISCEYSSCMRLSAECRLLNKLQIDRHKNNR